MSLRSTLSDLFNERTNYDFVGRIRRWFLLSAALIAIGLVSLGTRGLVFGIDFEGGTAWQLETAEAKGKPSVAEVRDAIDPLGLDAAKVQIVGGNGIRVQFEHVEREPQNKVRDALADYAGVAATDVSISDVGPTWGSEVSRKAAQALVVFFFAIAAYLSWRFEPKMAGAAIVAVVHDIFITVGVYSLSGFEVSPATVIAFLTILGFSLYDTVVVFDKVDENVSRISTAGGETYSSLVNRSLNEVLMRSLNTSFVALLPVGSMLVVGSYFMGALVIRDFALALFIGLLTGAYSSIFIATPVLALWKEREPRYRTLRNRIESRSIESRSIESRSIESRSTTVPASEPETPGSEPFSPATRQATGPVAPPDVIAPRARKRRRG